MWLLTSPLSLIALAAIPVLVGIYLFRTRSRRYVVSSLFLWIDQQQSRQGGRQISKLQTPLLFFLELMALALLALAAAGPNLRSESVSHPTVIVLDCSYSMTAGLNGDTPQQRALDDLTIFLQKEQPYPLQFVLAGTEINTISGRAMNAAEAERMLANWQCRASTALIDSAISFASGMSVADVKILVVTDQLPQVELPVGKIEWRAYGKPLDNLALSGASRIYQGEKDKLLVEVTNFSNNAQTLRMELTAAGTLLQNTDEPISPMATRRYHLTLPDGIQDVEIRIADDALPLDNHAVLLPPNRRPVRVAIRDLSESIASPLRRGLAATGIVQFDELNPEICFTAGDFTAAKQDMPELPGGCWLMRFYTALDEAQTEAFVGPFIIDRTHTLAEGLSLEGVVWAAANEVSLPGYSMLAVGNVPLVSEMNRPNRTKHLHLQIRPDLSTLTISPGWPVLLWNILQYRAAQSPGIRLNNVRLGTAAVFNPLPGDGELQITLPSGEIRTMAVRSNWASIPADEVGVSTVRAASGEYRFSVLPPASEESDLTQAVTGRWGGWLDQKTLESDYRNIVWLPLLAVAAILLLHLSIIATRKSELQKPEVVAK
ncbi:MAG: BatA domain-containing protein [Planctomycetaceae bacterium]|nr:BatA domain-containing protein [Planctomycetaceae bacterium]